MIVFFQFLSVLSSVLFAQPEACWRKAVLDRIGPALPQGARIELVLGTLPSNAQGNCKLGAHSPDMPLGLVNFEVLGTETPKGVRRSLSATVHAFVPVAVATQPIGPGESFDVANTRFEEREISRLVQTGYFTDKALVFQRKSRSHIGPGKVIGSQNSQLPALVNAGETVNLKHVLGAMVLKAKVRSLQAGRQDQWVQVLNPSSGKLLLARVSGAGEVEVR